MGTKGVLIALSLCAAFSPATTLHAGTPDCTLKQYASLPLIGDPSRQLVVPVTLQDSQVYMALDVANAISSITESAVRRLSLQTHPVPSEWVMRAGKLPINTMVTIKGFALGNTKFDNVDLVVIPDATLRPSLSGVLGMNLFAHMDVEIDAVNRKVNLFSPDHCAGQVVYWSKDYDSVPIRFGPLGEFYFPMVLDGKKIETTLATADDSTTLSTEVTKRFYGFDAGSPDIESETDAAGKVTSHYRAMKLSAQGLDVINANIRLVEPAGGACVLTNRSGMAAYDGCYGIHPLRLGLGVLTKLHVYIATKEKVLYFTPAVTDERPATTRP